MEEILYTDTQWLFSTALPEVFIADANTIPKGTEVLIVPRESTKKQFKKSIERQTESIRKVANDYGLPIKGVFPWMGKGGESSFWVYVDLKAKELGVNVVLVETPNRVTRHPEFNPHKGIMTEARNKDFVEALHYANGLVIASIHNPGLGKRKLHRKQIERGAEGNLGGRPLGKSKNVRKKRMSAGRKKRLLPQVINLYEELGYGRKKIAKLTGAGISTVQLWIDSYCTKRT